jgi:molybdopterin-guanine dinucleotide biosynthesis adapter protein
MVLQMGRSFPVICIVAPGSGYGKTRLLEYLVREITGSGKTVCVLKHSGHEFTPDEGKDTFIYRSASARASGVLTKGGLLALFIPESSMEESLGLMGALNPDLVLCEGFKGSPYPKIILLRNSDEFGILPALENVIAILSEGDVPDWVKVPVVRRKEDVLAIIMGYLHEKTGR